MVKSCLHRGPSRWRSLAVLFWDLVPELSVLSAMKSLNYVTPSVVLRDITAGMLRVMDEEGARRWNVLKLVSFVLARVFHFLVGFEAFMIKFHLAAGAVREAT